MKKGPYHLGIIMDGNRRFAREKGLSPLKGHEFGVKVFEQLGKWCLERGIHILTIYAFSSENWKRTKEEVDYLLRLLELSIEKHFEKVHNEGIQINILGDLSRLSEGLREKLRGVVEKTKENTKGILNVALNYGGRWDIVEAVKKIVASGISQDQITEDTVRQNLSTASYPDPELIIRTSGEQRLSNFLTWQSAYSELYFCPKFWPEFTKEDFGTAIDWYLARQRRFGK